MKQEFVFGERPPQLDAHAAPGLRLRPQRREENAIGLAAVRLRLVEREVGIGDELIGVGCVIGGNRDPGAAAEMQNVAVDVERLRQPPFRIDSDDVADDAAGIPAFGNDDDELVAAEAGIPGRVGQAAPMTSMKRWQDFDQQLIAGRVTERVIDVLETVEVEQRDRHGGVLTSHQQASELFLQRKPVGQAGQRIIMGKPPQLLFRQLAVGDVLVGTCHAAHGTVGIVHRRGCKPHIDHRAVLATPLQFDVPIGVAAGGALEQGLRVVHAVRRHELDRQTDHLFGGVAEHFFGHPIPEHGLAIKVAADDRDRGASMTAANVSLACRTSSAVLLACCARRSSAVAMRLKSSASAPTSSSVRTVLRWLSSPEASREASFPSWRSGRTRRPERNHAMAEPTISVPMMKSAFHPRRVATEAKTASVGEPTLIRQGARCAVEKAVIRSIPSDWTHRT